MMSREKDQRPIQENWSGSQYEGRGSKIPEEMSDGSTAPTGDIQVDVTTVTQIGTHRSHKGRAPLDTRNDLNKKQYNIRKVTKPRIINGQRKPKIATPEIPRPPNSANKIQCQKICETKLYRRKRTRRGDCDIKYMA